MGKLIDLKDLFIQKQENTALKNHNYYVEHVEAERKLKEAIELLLPYRKNSVIKPIVFQLQEALFYTKKFLEEN